jgi:hypothetical protein
MIANTRNRDECSARSAPLLALCLAASLTACGSLLDVDNPNNIKAEDIEKPVAATSLANGALSAVARGISGATLPYATASDELDWSGSRDSWKELELGTVHNPFNEFTDGFFPNMGRGRWLADEAVRVLELHQANLVLADPIDLARAYLYAAVAYTAVADIFEDWALSNADSAAAPYGRANMHQFYDIAVGYIDKGLAIASGEDDEVTLRLRAMRARANFAKAIWQQLHASPAQFGAIQSATAAADANAAIALLSDPDWRWDFTYSPTTISSDWGSWIASRQEMRVGAAYAAPDPSGKPTWTTTTLMDPVDNVPDPNVDRVQKALLGDLYPDFTVVSAREMHVIVAEDEYARNGATATFQAHVNAIRDLNGLTDWTPASTVSALNILKHERRSSIFLQGKRLADMYRFQEVDPLWLTGSEAQKAATTGPAVFFPITIIECLANPNIGSENCGK